MRPIESESVFQAFLVSPLLRVSSSRTDTRARESLTYRATPLAPCSRGNNSHQKVAAVCALSWRWIGCEGSRVAQGRAHYSSAAFIVVLASSSLERCLSHNIPSLAKAWARAQPSGREGRAAGRPVIHASARESRQPEQPAPEGSNSREPRDCPKVV